MRKSTFLRMGTTCSAAVVVVAAFEIGGLSVSPWRLCLLTCLCVAVAWLVADSLVDPGPPWKIAIHSAQAVPPGNDRRLQIYTRIVDSHRTGRVPDENLRDRLWDLAQRRLEQKYGTSLQDLTPGMLLSDELRDVLNAPPRRIKGSELSLYLKEIEEL